MKARVFILIAGIFMSSSFNLDRAFSLSLILALEALLIRVWALEDKKDPISYENYFYKYLLLAGLVSLYLAASPSFYIYSLLAAGLISYLLPLDFRLPFYLLVQTLAFRSQKLQVTRSMDIGISFFYGILMIFASLAILERWKHYKRKP